MELYWGSKCDCYHNREVHPVCRREPSKVDDTHWSPPPESEEDPES